MAITLVIGGARSGKSRYAEDIATKINSKRVYIATAQATDQEMQVRIQIHQNTRDNAWVTIESPLNIIDSIKKNTHCTILIDCLTLWLNNILFYEPDTSVDDKITELLSIAKLHQGDIFLVSNEVGLGIIPLGEISRRFVDEAGRMNQKIAAAADKVIFMVAGIPMQIKPTQ